MTNPIPLSPTACAVWEAFNSKFDWVEDGVPGPQFHSVAAALRAVADQVVPLCNAPKIPFDAKRPTVGWHVWDAEQRARADILAIATELENQ